MFIIREIRFITGTVLLFLFTVSTLHSQTRQPAGCDSILISLYEPCLTGDLSEKQENTIFSQSFIDLWLKGTVELYNGLTVSNKYLKYNGFTDRLIWLREDFRQVSLDQEPILAFTLSENSPGKKGYRFEKISVRDNPDDSPEIVFAQLLHKEDISLYVQRKVIKTGITEGKSGLVLYDVYEKRNIYYFKNNQTISRGLTRLNRKTLVAVLPEYRENLTEWLRHGRQTRIRTEEDLIRFTLWLNSWQKSRVEP